PGEGRSGDSEGCSETLTRQSLQCSPEGATPWNPPLRAGCAASGVERPAAAQPADPAEVSRQQAKTDSATFTNRRAVAGKLVLFCCGWNSWGVRPMGARPTGAHVVEADLRM